MITFFYLFLVAISAIPFIGRGEAVTLQQYHPIIARTPTNVTSIANVTLVDPSVLKVNPIVDANLSSVVFPVLPGVDLTHLAPVFSTADGVVASPEPGTVVDLRNGVTYLLIYNGDVVATWEFKAEEMRSPVLPGLYADPNIAIFNQTYYIYATTDGFSGWGGNSFYVWKSPDLESWTRSSGPFLVLNGTSGSVPWATGNA